MTQRGILTSITRHGLNRGEYGPIRKATFEETVEILLEAGIFSEKDDLKGISENVLLGKLTNIGTGSFNLLVDINAFDNENKNMENEMQFDEERMLNSDYEANDGQTPVISTPGYGYNNNIAMSVYDNSARFTPAHDNNPSSIQSPFHNPGSFYKDTFISSPEQGKNAPSSPEYNPQSDYYKTPAPYSPMPNDDGNRGQSQYGVSAYSPTMSPGFNSGTGVLIRPLQTGNKGVNSTYSPTTPGYLRPSSSSPQYIQGSGSGLYNSTPKVQGSGNTSQYHPASPGYYPTSPSYNIKAIDNASPFYNQDKDEDDEEEEEENNDEDDKNNN
jgi:DNA-directed RNA polymerase II subunit RPB1